MRLTPGERDRLLIFTTAELARRRRARGLRLNVPEATALIADTVCEAARDGRRLHEAISAGRAALGPGDVLPGVAEVMGDVKVEAVFDDGTRLVVVTDPIGAPTGEAADSDTAPGAILLGPEPLADWPGAVTVFVTNTSTVPISVTSHFHFFEVNPELDFARAEAFGMRLDVPAGTAVRFEPGDTREVELVAIGGARELAGLNRLVEGRLDDPDVRRRALAAVKSFLSAEQP